MSLSLSSLNNVHGYLKDIALNSEPKSANLTGLYLLALLQVLILARRVAQQV